MNQYYLRQRYYGQNQGRFIAVDPFEGFLDLPESLHPYTYASNNPAIFIDPSGLQTLLQLQSIQVQAGILASHSATVAVIEGHLTASLLTAAAGVAGCTLGIFLSSGISIHTSYSPGPRNFAGIGFDVLQALLGVPSFIIAWNQGLINCSGL